MGHQISSDDPLDQLPEIHRRLLELLAQDLAPELIAERLGVEVETISPMATVAAAKLARLSHPSSWHDVPEGP